jgi:hypothetical protein
MTWITWQVHGIEAILDTVDLGSLGLQTPSALTNKFYDLLFSQCFRPSHPFEDLINELRDTGQHGGTFWSPGISWRQNTDQARETTEAIKGVAG